MKKTLLITDLDFWKADIGSRQRILKMVQYLNIYTNITILYLKKITKTDKEKILKLNLQNVVSLLDTKIIQSDLESTCITKTKFLENFYSHDLKTRFIKYLSLNHYDNLIIEYIKLDYLLNDIHDIYCTIVDTHDLMSRRTISYSKYNEKPSIVFENLKQEIDILKHYDYVLSIQKNEYETLINEIEKNKILLVQHAVDINQKSHINQKVKNIVFVSGPANLQHIVWFIKNIWIYFQDNKTVHLNIYGTVCSKLQNFKNYKQLYLKGPVEYLDD
ncbi:MAG: hypothetical protein U9Q83_04290, partial [Bacteroidota bacterium]|nr:hypothetical protein [Bacteroidota bacterium]